MPRRLTFGLFELDAEALELRRQGRLVKLQPQPCRVLSLLAERAGDVVSREELRAHLWGEATVVDFERGLNYAIARIRGALNDTAESPRYVETLPRRGYRFIAPVTVAAGDAAGREVGAGAGAAAAPGEPGVKAAMAGPPARGHLRTSSLLAAALLLALVIGAALAVRAARTPPPDGVVLAVMPFIDLSDGAVPEAWRRGLTEETVTRLAEPEASWLTVIGNAPILRRGGAEPEIPRIGQELGATFVVLGRLRREDDRVRCTVHLIRVRDFGHLWTGIYERRLSEGLDAHRDIAIDIAGQVHRTLAADHAPSAAPPTR